MEKNNKVKEKPKANMAIKIIRANGEVEEQNIPLEVSEPFIEKLKKQLRGD